MDNLTPLKSRGLVWIVKHGEASGEVVVLHTVTAGKKFYLTFISLLSWADAAVASCDLSIRDASDVIWVRLIHHAVSNATTRSLSVVCSIVPPLEVPAGYDIYLEAGTDGLARGAILGWEE